MAQQCRVLAAFLLNLILFPAPTSDDVRSTVSAVTGDQMHSWSLCGHAHTYGRHTKHIKSKMPFFFFLKKIGFCITKKVTKQTTKLGKNNFLTTH